MDWAIIWYESVYNKDKTEKEKGKEMFHVWGKKKKVQEQGVSNFAKPTAIELIQEGHGWTGRTNDRNERGMKNKNGK